MKAATINELKLELQAIPPATVLELCLRLARFKKENKELLTYLLFEANDKHSYIKNVQQEIAMQMETTNTSSVYLAKKTIRKVLRTTNKFIRYSNDAVIEIELLLYYCVAIKNLGTKIYKNPIVANLCQNQLKKINKTLATLHEEEQYDYRKTIAWLQE
jgi:hypothetical protein